MPRVQPLFDGARRQIARQIEQGELAPGDRLPSERWFGESLNVSRTTVRRAIEELISEGMLEVRGGVVHVAGKADDGPGNALMSITEFARSRGLTPTAQVLAFEVRSATLDEADLFQIGPGAEMLELRRLRLLDGAAVAVDHNRVPMRMLPTAREIDFTGASLYGALGEAGYLPVKSDLTIEARNPTAEEAELLELAPGVPLLVAGEKTFDSRDRVVCLGRTVYRSDRYRFFATFTRTTFVGSLGPAR